MDFFNLRALTYTLISMTSLEAKDGEQQQLLLEI